LRAKMKKFFNKIKGRDEKGDGRSRRDKFGIPERSVATIGGTSVRMDKKEDTDAVETVSRRELQIKLLQKHRSHRGKVFTAPLDLESDWKPPVFAKDPSIVAFIEKELSENFIFAQLSEKERKHLIDAMQQEKVKEGHVIIKEGDVGDFFYLIESGQISFSCDGKSVGTAKSGASFGELALLYDAPRAATCVATADTTLWKVDQHTFRHMIALESSRAEQDVGKILKKVPILSDVSDDVRNHLADALTVVTFKEGQKIVNKGEEGDVFYIVKDGNIKVHDIGLGQSQFNEQILKTGDWFGERALITGEPRAANVTAVTDCTIFAVSRETFENAFGSLNDLISFESKKNFLKTVPIFAESKFEDHEMTALTENANEVTMKSGEMLVKRGEAMDPNLTIITKGRLLITTSDGKLIKLQEGDYFGDKYVTTKEPTTVADVDVSVEEDTTCWVLTKQCIERTIGDVARLGNPLPYVSSSVNNSIQLKDITKHRILGMGAFGKVWLTTHKKTKTPYALKMMSKAQLLQTKQTTSVLREKNVMASIEHPFIMDMVSSFQDANYVYFLLEVVQGGELFNVLHTDRRDGVPNEHAEFYGACVIRALAHLHKRSIVYRDLKPENVLVDSRGYCVVADMGFAKIVVDKTYTLCGTPEYLAPEIIMSKGHDAGADYWAFGVLMYEMLAGQSAFYMYGTDQASLFKRIVLVKYDFTKSFNDDLKDLITKLLIRRPANRLGKLKGGAADIENHAYFKNIDFDKLVKKEIPAPWVPAIKDPLDASHFEDFRSEEKEDRGLPKLSAEHQAKFKDF